MTAVWLDENRRSEQRTGIETKAGVGDGRRGMWARERMENKYIRSGGGQESESEAKLCECLEQDCHLAQALRGMRNTAVTARVISSARNSLWGATDRMKRFCQLSKWP